MSAPCLFRQHTGPLMPGVYRLYPGYRGVTPFLAHIKQVFVERATCGRRGHVWHYAAEMDDPRYGYDGWIYAISGKDGLRILLTHGYLVAPGCTTEAPRFVLCPHFQAPPTRTRTTSAEQRAHTAVSTPP